jgi:hypothetical protein
LHFSTYYIRFYLKTLLFILNTILSEYTIYSYIKERRVWRYQRGNQNPYIEEEQTTQWPKEKVQKDKQRSTKHTYKTKDWVTRTPLKPGGELGWSGRVSSSCSTSDTRRINIVTNLRLRSCIFQIRNAPNMYKILMYHISICLILLFYSHVPMMSLQLFPRLYVERFLHFWQNFLEFYQVMKTSKIKVCLLYFMDCRYFLAIGHAHISDIFSEGKTVCIM